MSSKKRKNTITLQLNLKDLCPKDWRFGQFIFNFGEYLAQKGYPANQSYRMADMFHISDKEFEKELTKYLKTINH